MVTRVTYQLGPCGSLQPTRRSRVIVLALPLPKCVETGGLTDADRSTPARKCHWSQPLPQPLVIPGVMTLKTPAKVRKLVGHLPKDVATGCCAT